MAENTEDIRNEYRPLFYLKSLIFLKVWSCVWCKRNFPKLWPFCKSLKKKKRVQINRSNQTWPVSLFTYKRPGWHTRDLDEIQETWMTYKRPGWHFWKIHSLLACAEGHTLHCAVLCKQNNGSHCFINFLIYSYFSELAKIWGKKVHDWKGVIADYLSISTERDEFGFLNQYRIYIHSSGSSDYYVHKPRHHATPPPPIPPLSHTQLEFSPETFYVNRNIYYSCQCSLR